MLYLKMNKKMAYIYYGESCQFQRGGTISPASNCSAKKVLGGNQSQSYAQEYYVGNQFRDQARNCLESPPLREILNGSAL